MSVIKTSYGTYRARIRDAQGRQITKTFKLKADANTWERDQLRARDRGAGLATSRTTLADFAEVWLAGARNLAGTTEETYRKSLRLYIVPAIGDLPMAKVNADVIDALLTSLIDRGLGPSTVHRCYRTLHRLGNVAVNRGHLVTNPCQFVVPPKVTSTEMRFLSPAEIKAVSEAIHPRYRRLILVAGWSGIRWGELQALRPDDFDGRAITVIKQSGDRDVKTKASRRRVVLPPSVAAELVGHVEEFPGTHLFNTGGGKMLGHSGFTGNNWKPALRRAGVDTETRFHDLRHSAVALAIRAGAHPKMVADMMGHSSIRVTMDRYGHLFPVIHDEVADAMDLLYRASPA